jgi:hypothetical protein
VNRPSVDQDSGTGEEFTQAKTVRFSEGSGELLVHSLLPEKRIITRRGGNGHEFYTPGDDAGGPWGSGENWPLEDASGSALPEDPKLRRMWKLFWGDDFNRILSSNRKNVVPGSWRIEVSPSAPSQEDLFLHVLEIGDIGKTGHSRVELLDGAGVKGAAFERGPMILFGTTDSPVGTAEVSLPDLDCNSLIATGLQPDSLYEINLNGLNVSTSVATVLPGISAGAQRLRANAKGILLWQRNDLKDLRLRLTRV